MEAVKQSHFTPVGRQQGAAKAPAMCTISIIELTILVWKPETWTSSILYKLEVKIQLNLKDANCNH